MDDKFNRDINGERVDVEPAEERTVSFLRERRSFSIESMREYATSPQGKRNFIIAGVVLALLLLILVLSAASLPGQLLYGVKTNVLEGMGGLVRFTTESQAAYQRDLLETRLSETKRLAQRETVDEGAVSALTAATLENVEAYMALTQPSEERTLDRRVVLELSNSFVIQLSVMEEIAEGNESLVAFAEVVSDAESDAMRRLRDEIEVYVSLIDDAGLHTFLSSELQDISSRVDEGGLSQDTQDRVGRMLGDVAEAVVDNDAAEAIEAIFEAKRLIASDENLPEETVPETEAVQE